MRGGSSGGGGGAALAYLMIHHPKTTMGLFGVGALCFAGYMAAVQLDMPDREPIASDIVLHSIDKCPNGYKQTLAYTQDLKSMLMAEWSETLADIRDNGPSTICIDPDLRNAALTYDDTMDDLRRWGELRTVAVLINENGGDTQTLVLKPASAPAADSSTDGNPDSTASISKIWTTIQTDNIPSYQMEMPGGALASVLLQRDGLMQKANESKDHTDDGLLWATEDTLDRMGYDFHIN